MRDIRFILNFFERAFIAKVLLLTLLYTLLPLAEIFLLIYIGDYHGKYLMLALAASTGLFGVLVAMVEFRKTISKLKDKIREGSYPGQEFIVLTGIFTGSILLISPGFITDFIGFLMFVPVIRNLVGRFITQKLDKQLKEVYEYLKLYEL